jgi:hypothetical protein
MTLVLLTALPWSRGTLFSGAVDITVLAKAAIGVSSFFLVFLIPGQGWQANLIPSTPAILVLAYLAITVVGGAQVGKPLPSLITAGHVVILLAVLALLAARVSRHNFLFGAVFAAVLIAVCGAVTGLGLMAADGRLRGGFPALSPNEMARLLGFVLVCLGAYYLDETRLGIRATGSQPAPSIWRLAGFLVTAAILSGGILLTGSRTSLAAFGMASVLVITFTRRASLLAWAAVFVGGAGALGVAGYSSVLSDLATRNDVGTLSNRTIAWQAALAFPESQWERLVGTGLSTKSVPVSARFRNEQILDSSWVSALVQAGYLGTVLIALFALVTLIIAWRSPHRALTGSLATCFLLMSVLESGLLDATSLFVLYLVVVLFAGIATEDKRQQGGQNLRHHPRKPTLIRQ